MLSFLLFFALLFVAMGLAAAFAYPMWKLVSLFADFPIDRVMSRFAMVFILLGLILLTRRMGLADRQTLGYGLPRRQFIKQMCAAFLIGIALMLPLTASLLGLGIRVPSPDVSTVQAFLATVGKGLLTGVGVAFTEETFFRGALFAAVQRESGVKVAMLLTSLLYAVLHFIGGKLSIPPEATTWMSGVAVYGNLFEQYLHPLKLLDSMLSLLAVGLLLAMVRVRTGAIAACIGLHAGWVSVITVIRSATDRNYDSPYGWMIGSYNGVIGWLATAWIGLFALIYWWQGRRGAPTVISK
jgi:membrane protease YdiL (CAAX protease family)